MTIANVKTEQCEGVCAYWGRGHCLVWSKIFRNAIFLPSDHIRPKAESTGYIIRCTFENYYKPCVLSSRSEIDPEKFQTIPK